MSIESTQSDSPASLTAHYKTTSSTYSGATNANGRATISFGVGRPTIGYTVRVDVTVGSARCSTEFTP